MTILLPPSKYPLPARVDPATGVYASTVRQTFHCADSYWDDSGFSDSLGHRYLCLNSLGKSSKSPLQIASQVKNGLVSVFPGGATGTKGPQVTLDNVFQLTPLRFEVRVIAVDSWSFTLRTERWHPLIGTARHGIFKDKEGELWLMQEGLGRHGEYKGNMQLNYWGARYMWRVMATAITRKFL